MKYKLRAIGAVVIFAALVVSTMGAFAQNGEYEPIATPEFQQVWGRNDYPVQQFVVPRTWTWGPGANSPLMSEPYFEAPGGFRDVQYFDKSRMEMPWIAGGDPDSPWFITQGLLARELMTGQLQLGNNLFEQHAPSQRPAAGDPDDAHGPTYAIMGQAMEYAARDTGSTITQVIDRQGALSENADLATYGVTDAYFVPETGHNVASEFWTFINGSGPVYQGGDFVDGPIFENPFYAVGLPITEAYWAWVKVAGVQQNVLIQCFERRCLTFTPDNPQGWEVESGNIGQHHYHWRYEEIERSTAGVSFSVTPEDETNQVGDAHELTVTAFDYDGATKDGVPVSATVISTTGSDQEHLDVTMTGTSGDDGDGVAILSYVGAEPASDTIEVSVAGVLESQTVHKTWVIEQQNEAETDPDSIPDPPQDDQPGDPFTIALAHDGPDSNVVGEAHTVIATVEEEGNTVADGTTIEFEIDGPNANLSGTADTEDGVAMFTYTGTITGEDQIRATWNDIESNTITKTWVAGGPAGFTLKHAADFAAANGESAFSAPEDDAVPNGVIYLEPHTVVGTVIDGYGNPVQGAEVDFSITGPNSHVSGTTELTSDTPNRGVTDGHGIVTFAYIGTAPGVDTIDAILVESSELNASLDKLWLDLRVSLKHGAGHTGENLTGTDHTVTATVEYFDLVESDWQPLADVDVEFETVGSNVGSQTVTTGMSGTADFTYTGSNSGQDTITSTIVDTPLSDAVSKIWTLNVTLSHVGDATNPLGSSHTVEALVEDANGPVDGISVSIEIKDGPNAGKADTGVTANDGIATFTYTDDAQVEGTDVINAAAIVDAMTVGTDTIEKHWEARRAHSFSVAEDGETNPTGTSHEITITVYDQFGDEFQGAHVTASVTAGPNAGSDLTHQNSDTTGTTWSDGTAVMSYTGAQSATGTDTITVSVAGITESQSVTKIWTSGEPHDIVLEHVGDSENGVATNTVGENHSVKATVVDVHGNTVTDFAGDITLSINGVAQTPDVTAANGVATFTYTSSTAGTDSLSAASGDLSSNTLTQHWVAGDPHELVLSHTGNDYDDPETSATNVLGEHDDHTVYARVRDEYGNPVANGRTIDFVVTNADGGAQAASGSDTTTGGIASFTYDAPAGPETHEIVATWVDPVAATSANQLTLIWENYDGGSGEPVSVSISICGDLDLQEIEGEFVGAGPSQPGNYYCILEALVTDERGNAVDGVDVSFKITSNPTPEPDGSGQSANIALRRYQGPDTPNGTEPSALVQVYESGSGDAPAGTSGAVLRIQRSNQTPSGYELVIEVSINDRVMTTIRLTY